MNKETFYTLSHDSKDAPNYTHVAYILKSPMPEIKELVAICDDERSHLMFLRGWINCELDIETQWNLNNGIFAVKIVLSKGKHKVKYHVKLTVKQAEQILRTPLNGMAVCDGSKRIIMYFKPLKVKQLFEFYKMKHATDRYVIDNIISTPGWHVG